MTDDRNRVVFVTQMFPPETGGNASRIQDTATNLEEASWNVTVLAPPPTIPPGEFDRSWRRARTTTVDGVTVHRLWSPQPMSADPTMTRRLAYYIVFGLHAALWLVLNVRRYDVVITSSPPISTGAPGLVAAALGTPWVVDVRDLWIDAAVSLGHLEAGSRLERLSRAFQRLVLHTADRITLTTETTEQTVRDLYGDDLAAKMLVLPNGVDTERFAPAHTLDTGTEPTPETADGFSTDGAGGPTIVYTGNLGTAQDLEACIRAMTHLEEDQATLVLIGGGDTESELRRLAVELGVEDRVEFRGPVPREAVPRRLDDATVGVAPLVDTDELSYAMPTKVYEYMACGLPTVVTGRGEIARFASRSGCLHADNDPERIAERFDELLADDRLRDQLGRAGRTHVVEQYDRRAITRRLDAELTALVETHA